MRPQLLKFQTKSDPVIDIVLNHTYNISNTQYRIICLSSRDTFIIRLIF